MMQGRESIKPKAEITGFKLVKRTASGEVIEIIEEDEKGIRNYWKKGDPNAAN